MIPFSQNGPHEGPTRSVVPAAPVTREEPSQWPHALVTPPRDGTPHTGRPSEKRSWAGIDQQEIARLLELKVDQSPLPQVVADHNQRFPFAPRSEFRDRQVWLEGSYNPPTGVHLARALELLSIGFERIVVGILPYNPRKPRHEYEPLQHRIEMWKLLAEHYGVPLAKTPSDKGLWFCETGVRCHVERYRSWFDPERFILMGPDNFTHFRTTNMTWTLLAHRVPVWQHLQQYNRLYDNVFAHRVLVPTSQYVQHSTAIRRGQEEAHPAIASYVREHGLYGRKPVLG
jgi:nicotinic acid mononucleotide adenylyltransferase